MSAINELVDIYRNSPMAKQENDYNCGAVCLQWIYKRLAGKDMSQKEIEKMGGVTEAGMTHAQLEDVARQMGFQTKQVIFGDAENAPSQISEVPEHTYGIVGWTPYEEHYSVMNWDPEEDFITVIDPGDPSCISLYPMKEFVDKWFDSDGEKEFRGWALFIWK